MHKLRFHVWIYYSAWSSLMQEIQFLEFMGGPQAFPNYWICLCFIRINTIFSELACFTATRSNEPPPHFYKSWLQAWGIIAKYSTMFQFQHTTTSTRSCYLTMDLISLSFTNLGFGPEWSLQSTVSYTKTCFVPLFVALFWVQHLTQ